MARLQHKAERSKADKRQNGSNNETGSPEKCKRNEIFSGLDPTLIQICKQPVQENRQNAEIVEERLQVEMDNRNKWRLRKIKKEITEAPCLAHFDPKKDNYVTTDACNTGLGATLLQKEGEVFRAIAFASKCLTDCEKKYAINELELLVALWGLENFRYYVYGKIATLETDHQALQALLINSIERD